MAEEYILNGKRYKVKKDKYGAPIFIDGNGAELTGDEAGKVAAQYGTSTQKLKNVQKRSAEAAGRPYIDPSIYSPEGRQRIRDEENVTSKPIKGGKQDKSLEADAKTMMGPPKPLAGIPQNSQSPPDMGFRKSSLLDKSAQGQAKQQGIEQGKAAQAAGQQPAWEYVKQQAEAAQQAEAGKAAREATKAATREREAAALKARQNETYAQQLNREAAEKKQNEADKALAEKGKQNTAIIEREAAAAKQRNADKAEDERRLALKKEEEAVSALGLTQADGLNKNAWGWAKKNEDGTYADYKPTEAELAALKRHKKGGTKSLAEEAAENEAKRQAGKENLAKVGKGFQGVGEVLLDTFGGLITVGAYTNHKARMQSHEDPDVTPYQQAAEREQAAADAATNASMGRNEYLKPGEQPAPQGAAGGQVIPPQGTGQVIPPQGTGQVMPAAGGQPQAGSEPQPPQGVVDPQALNQYGVAQTLPANNEYPEADVEALINGTGDPNVLFKDSVFAKTKDGRDFIKSFAEWTGLTPEQKRAGWKAATTSAAAFNAWADEINALPDTKKKIVHRVDGQLPIQKAPEAPAPQPEAPPKEPEKKKHYDYQPDLWGDRALGRWGNATNAQLEAQRQGLEMFHVEQERQKWLGAKAQKIDNMNFDIGLQVNQLATSIATLPPSQQQYKMREWAHNLQTNQAYSPNAPGISPQEAQARAAIIQQQTQRLMSAVQSNSMQVQREQAIVDGSNRAQAIGINLAAGKIGVDEARAQVMSVNAQMRQFLSPAQHAEFEQDNYLNLVGAETDRFISDAQKAGMPITDIAALQAQIGRSVGNIAGAQGQDAATVFQNKALAKAAKNVSGYNYAYLEQYDAQYDEALENGDITAAGDIKSTFDPIRQSLLKNGLITGADINKTQKLFQSVDANGADKALDGELKRIMPSVLANFDGLEGLRVGEALDTAFKNYRALGGGKGEDDAIVKKKIANQFLDKLAKQSPLGNGQATTIIQSYKDTDKIIEAVIKATNPNLKDNDDAAYQMLQSGLRDTHIAAISQILMSDSKEKPALEAIETLNAKYYIDNIELFVPEVDSIKDVNRYNRKAAAHEDATGQDVFNINSSLMQKNEDEIGGIIADSLYKAFPQEISISNVIRNNNNFILNTLVTGDDGVSRPQIFELRPSGKNKLELYERYTGEDGQSWKPYKSPITGKGVVLK